ncbi:hypothetical protein, partial [Mesorhizobium sp. M0643]|uniref:hypothetical protein n=1 Tax=Mesorhizobium sp. M0643 TaxID=2956978 RepID=UPI003339EACE
LWFQGQMGASWPVMYALRRPASRHRVLRRPILGDGPAGCSHVYGLFPQRRPSRHHARLASLAKMKPADRFPINFARF